MSRVIYLNGSYRPYHEALLHVEDRATLFADSVYEVIEVKNGHRVDEKGHLQRLARSLDELNITPSFTLDNLPVIISEVVRRNRVKNGYVYLQISRGIAPRDFIFPDPASTATSLTIIARAKNPAIMNNKASRGIKVITLPDMRWKRPDIKTTSLIASVLARQSAAEQGAEEAWLYNGEGQITEGAASNAWIITNRGELITHPADRQILKGITREGVFRVAEHLNLSFKQRPFLIEEAKTAKEAFISAATNLVMPVTHIDEAPVNNGEVGPLVLKLRQLFHEFAQLSD